MLRRLFAIFFILTSLSAQASTAFACEMMGKVVMHDCCCGGDAAMSIQTHGDQPCCQEIVLVGEDEATSASAVASKAAQPDFQPQPLATPPADVVVLRAFPPRARTLAVSAPLSRSGSLTYLHTQRLRI